VEVLRPRLDIDVRRLRVLVGREPVEDVEDRDRTPRGSDIGSVPRSRTRARTRSTTGVLGVPATGASAASGVDETTGTPGHGGRREASGGCVT
jgi:hypothetical protein